MAFTFPIWLAISLIMLVLLIILLRTTNQVYVLYLIRNNFFYFFVLLIFIFMTISLIHIHSTYDINFKTSGGIKEAFKIYYSLAANVFGNLAKVTGYAIKQDWLNSTVRK